MHGNTWTWSGKAFDYQAPAERTSWFAHLNYEVGDRLWVRENCQAVENGAGYDSIHYPADGASILIPDTRDAAEKWLDLRFYGSKSRERRGAPKIVPSIHMPRWASRLTLVVNGVKVERLQDISEADADDEGVYPAAVYGGQVLSWLPAADLRETFHPTAKEAFKDLWGRINGAGAWEANPWVVAVTFTVHKGNIDSVEER